VEHIKYFRAERGGGKLQLRTNKNNLPAQDFKRWLHLHPITDNTVSHACIDFTKTKQIVRSCVAGQEAREIRLCNWKTDPSRWQSASSQFLVSGDCLAIAASHHTLGSLYQASSYIRRYTQIKSLSSIESLEPLSLDLGYVS
jgi:hypothetical protein